MDYSSYPQGYLGGMTAFFANEASRTSGQDLYPDVFKSILFPLQRQLELEKMVAEARRRTPEPKVVMEVGSDKGGSFYHWVKGFPSVKKAIASEVRGCPFQREFQFNFPAVQFLFSEMSSYDPAAVAGVRDFLGEDKIDILFLDGDKGKFYEDFCNYRPLMRSGGTVFMHDIQVKEPKQAWLQATRDGYLGMTIIDVREGIAALDRARQQEPVTSSWESWLRTWNVTSCGVGVIYIP